MTARLPAAKVDVPNNTREGYVEIFNTADIRPGSDLFKATKHAPEFYD